VGLSLRVQIIDRAITIVVALKKALCQQLLLAIQNICICCIQGLLCQLIRLAIHCITFLLQGFVILLSNSLKHAINVSM